MIGRSWQDPDRDALRREGRRVGVILLCIWFVLVIAIGSWIAWA